MKCFEMTARLSLLTVMCIPLFVYADIEPDNLTAVPGLVRTYVASYVFDEAGNVTRINYRIMLGTMNSTQNEEEQQLVDRTHITIRTDEAWENISINTLETVEDGDMSLSVYNMSGAYCYSEKLSAGHTILNLSFLPKGIYLFHIASGSFVENYKLIKR